MNRELTADEARDLFSDAYDGELSGAQQAAFEAALEADPALYAEWEDFRDLLRGTHALGAGPLEGEPEVDLLGGIQTKLRTRSRGRYYRDRFSARSGPSVVTPLLLALIMLTLLGVAWFGLHMVEVGGDAPPASPPSSATERGSGS